MLKSLLAFWIFTIGLAEVQPLCAQIFHVHTYTESDGLPSSEVREMVQTADGRMWFATRNGISVYDGQTWLTYGIKDGLAGMDQALLAIDDKERIWAVSSIFQVRVSIFENGHWREIPSSLRAANASTILTLEGESTGALIGHEQGLIHVQDGVFRRLEFEGNRPTTVFRLERFGGSIYAATDNGLFTVKLNAQTELQKVSNSPDEPIKGIALDSVGNQLWVIGQDWIGTFDGSKWSRLEQRFDDYEAKLDSAVSAIAGPEGELYFGTRTGLFSYREQEGINRIGMENGLVSEGAQDILVDREGMLWVSCPRGVSKVVSFAFANYRHRNGLFDDEVAAVIHRSDGTIVLGHSRGLTVFDQKPVKTYELGTKLSVRYQDFAEDKSGTLWIAGAMAGLLVFEPAGEPKPFPIPVSWGNVNSVIVDQSDQLWVATDQGVYRRTGGQFYDESPHQDFANGDAYRKLFLDQQGRIVVASMSRGLWRLDADGWKNWPGGQNRQFGNIYAYFDQADGPTLIGTTAGLCTFKDDEIVKLKQPQIDRPVYLVFEDHQKRIWIGTDNGVQIWDGNGLRQVTVKRGLAGRETNRAAGKVDAKGRVWIGTTHGLSIYRPEFDREVSRPPDVKLMMAEAGGRSWDLSEAHAMSHDRSSLTFNYRVISFLDEHEILVRSWLEGLENGWQSPERPHEWKVRYNFLPPGRYQLHLQAANIDGQWSEVVSSNVIRIQPPFWMTRWFFALAIICVGSVGFFSHRLFNQRRYARRLEQEVVARVAELHESEKRYGVTLNSIAEGVISTGLNGDVLFMNPAAEQILGRSLSESRGQTLKQVFPLLDESNIELADLTSQLVKGKQWTASLKFNSPDEQARIIEVGTAPLRNADQRLLGAVVAIRDVTEKVRLQNELAQSQKLASLGTLAGGIAHDFNNLLAVININVSSLKQEAFRPTSKKAIDLVEGALTQATNLTQQIITFARGGAPLLETCWIDKLIRDSISFFGNEPDVHFDLELTDDLWPVDVDTVQINQVLQNILLNAIQAMPKGGEIGIRTNNCLDRGSRFERRLIEIEIQDSGVGIPSDLLDRVFEPYFTTKQNGNGIGLATSYSIIQRHEGILSVESEVGKGSTFRILLPASTETPTARETPTAAVAVTKPNPVASNRVLIVDDSALVRDSMRGALSTIGYDASDVADGEEAVEVYRRERASGQSFYAVLIDLTMKSGIGGQETIKRLLSIDPAVRGIVISGYSDDQVMSNYRSYGFVDRIEKPCSLEDLQAALATLPAIQDEADSN